MILAPVLAIFAAIVADISGASHLRRMDETWRYSSRLFEGGVAEDIAALLVHIAGRGSWPTLIEDRAVDRAPAWQRVYEFLPGARLARRSGARRAQFASFRWQDPEDGSVYLLRFEPWCPECLDAGNDLFYPTEARPSRDTWLRAYRRESVVRLGTWPSSRVESAPPGGELIAWLWLDAEKVGDDVEQVYDAVELQVWRLPSTTRPQGGAPAPALASARTKL